MTTQNQAQGQGSEHGTWFWGERGGGMGPIQGQRVRPRQNVGNGERAVSAAAGGILALQGLGRRSVPGLVMAAVGGLMLRRGVSGQCRLYQALDIDTAQGAADGRREQLERRGIRVAQAFLINKPAAELYRYWRNFENLPSIMSHLESVRVVDDRTSHWVAKAPRLAGGSVGWDARVTRDEPDKLIAWESMPGSSVDNSGQIEFTPAPGDRGTEVRVHMAYLPPAGRLGHLVAKVFGESADTQVREDLRNFKRVMECGEVPTIAGQPRGTCLGRGTRSPG